MKDWSEPRSLEAVLAARRRRAALAATISATALVGAWYTWATRIPDPIVVQWSVPFGVIGLTMIAVLSAWMALDWLGPSTPIGPAATADSARLANEFGEVRSYLAKVVAQGRPFLAEDYTAICTLSDQVRLQRLADDVAASPAAKIKA